MAVFTLDDFGITRLGGQTYGQQGYELTDESPVTGAAMVMPMGPPRWLASIRSPQAMPLAEAAAWEAMVLRLRRGINHLGLFDMLRPAPAGTLRGSPVLKSSVAIGASTMTLGNCRTAKNLLLYPHAFDNAVWANTATVTANTTARPGSSSLQADTVTDSSSVATLYLEQSLTVPDDTVERTVSVHVRKTSGGTSPTLRLRLAYTGGTDIFASRFLNTDTGVIIGGSGSAVDVDANWWRLSVTLANNGSGNTTCAVQIYPAAAPNGSNTITNSTTGSAILWGAQLELGASATDVEAAPTLSTGDWLQVGTGVGTSQLVKVMANATASSTTGDLFVTVEAPFRYALTGGTGVIWDKPVGYYKLRSLANTWQAVPNGPAIDGFALDLLEQWT